MTIRLCRALETPGRVIGVLCLQSVMLGSLLSAQTQAGDSLWRTGRFPDARVAYERALGEDSSAVRAWYRLAILASWDNQLDSALTLIQRARTLDPDDPDVRFTEAQVLSWDNRFDESLALWDSLLARYPDRRDAGLARARTLAWANRYPEALTAYDRLIATDSTDPAAYAGRAQVRAWQGHNAEAIADYRHALTLHPNDPEALVGLAQVYHWQGRDQLARAELGKVFQSDSTNRDAQRLSRLVRAAVRPRVTIDAGWNRDSDENQTIWQTLGSSMMLGAGLRGFVNAGYASLDDPVRDASRTMGDAGATFAVWDLQFTGSVGARRLDPSDSESRTVGTGRASVSWRIQPGAAIGLGYSTYPFDDTAFLVGSGLDLDNLDLAADINLTPTLVLSAGGGSTWVSDGNQRTGAVLALIKNLGPRWSVGVLGRTFAWDEAGVGYFSPDRFSLLEARGAYSYTKGSWSARASGGLGGQKFGNTGVQVAWRAELRGAYTWSTINRLEVFGGTTRNAGTSVAGAYQYWNAGVGLVIGL